MLVSAQLGPANRSFEGQTMDRIIAAKSKGRDPAPDPLDVLFEFLIEENGTIGTIYAHHTESDMNLALVQPWCSIGSDGYALAIEGPLRRGHPHPRSFGTFPRILGEYVRKRKLAEPRRRRPQDDVTECGQGRPFRSRAPARRASAADVTVFDPKTVIDRCHLSSSRFSTASGIEHVVVNGQLVLENRQPTDARPGACAAAPPLSGKKKKPARERDPNDYLSLSRSEPGRLAGSSGKPEACLSCPGLCVRKGERGVVRGNPLALWR